MKHTKTPWVSGPCCGGEDYPYTIITKGMETVVIVPKQENGVMEANAQFIVKAVNCHDELLEACKGLLMQTHGFRYVLPRNSLLGEAWKKAEAAIRKVEAGVR